MKQHWSCLAYWNNGSTIFWPIFPCPNINPIFYPYMIHYVTERQVDFYSCGGGSRSNEILSFTPEMLPSLSSDNPNQMFQGWFQDAKWTKPLNVGDRFLPRAISAYPKWLDMTTTLTAPMQIIRKNQNEYQQIYLETSSDIIRRPHSEKEVETSLQSLEAEVASLKQQLAGLTNGNEVGY